MGVASRGRAFLHVLVIGGVLVLAACTGDEHLGPVPIRESQIRITPSTLDLEALADLGQFTAQRTDGQGRPSNLNRFQWRSLAPGIAQVDGAGRVVSLAEGTATIEVSVAGETARAEVVVDQVPVQMAVGPSSNTLDAVGQSMALSFEARDRNGFRIRRSSVEWESDSPTVVTVDDEGTVTSRGEGETMIRARKRGRRDSTRIRVRRKSNAISILPQVDTLTAIGEESLLRAYATDSQGEVVADAGFTWSSSDPAVASVTTGGTVRALGVGSATVSAKMGSLVGTAEIVVEQSVENVTVTPSSAVIPAPSQTVQLTASGTDVRGGDVGAAFTWTSDRPGVATVDGSGLVTGVSQGTARISATAPSGAKGWATVSVGTVSLNVQPRADTLSAVGATTQFAIYPTDSSGSAIYCQNPAWTSLDTQVATVDQFGKTVAKAAGTALIVVAACAVQDTASVTVLSGGGGGGTAPPPPPPPPPPSSSTVAELPRLVPVLPSGYTRQVRLPAGGNLQAAINGAQAGDEILLAPGAKYTGEFILPNRGDQGWVRIATDLSVAAGARVDTTLNLATVTCASPNCSPFKTAAGAAGWEISLLEATTDLQYTGSIVQLHNTSQVPSRILIDRAYIHPRQYTTRCVLANANHLTIRHSRLLNCVNPGQQTQAIGSWHHSGPHLYLNNHLEGAAQAIIFGGASRPASVRPADITIRGNWLRYRDSWQGVYASLGQLEMKDGIRVLFEGNVLEGGRWAYTLKSSAQGGVCQSPCGTEDITIRYNIARDAGNHLNLAGWTNNGKGDHMSRVVFEQNLAERIGPDSQGWQGGTGVLIQILDAPNDLVIRDITLDTRGKTYTNFGPAPVDPALSGGVGNYFEYGNILVARPTNWGMSMGQGTTIDDHYAAYQLGTVYDNCGGADIPVTCDASTPSHAGADLSAINAATSGVVR